MQELCKFSFQINVIPNGLEKYISFNINNMLIFLESFQFLSSSLDSLVKSFVKDDFKYFSQEFDSKLLDLARQKGCYSYEYMSGFEKSKEELPSKEKFYRFKVWNKFEMKTVKDHQDLYWKCDVLLLVDVLKDLEIITLIRIMDHFFQQVDSNG